MYTVNLSNGKVKYCEKYRDPLTNKWKQVTVTMDKDTPRNRKVANDALNASIQKKIEETCIVTDEISLGFVLDQYYAFQEKTVKLSTSVRNKRTLNLIADGLGRDSIFNNLTAPYINNYLLSLNDEAGTTNEKVRRLKAFLNWAYQNDYLEDKKIIEKLVILKDTSHRVKIKDKYLEPEEITKLLNAFRNDDHMCWYHVTRILILSGLRIGELIALENNDIDDKFIHVTKTYDTNNCIITTTKTQMSERDVFIQPELAQALREARSYFQQDMMLRGYRTPLFAFSHSGGYISYNYFEKVLKETSELVLGRTVTSHTLRHTHASLLMANNVPIETITRRLGHTNSKITKEIYLHVTKKLLEQDNEQLSLTKIL